MSISNALKILCRTSFVQNVLSLQKHSISPRSTMFINQVRGMRKSYAQIGRVMKVRRKIAGPEKLKKRSDWYDWNYDAELYAFSKRLRENISSETMRCIFVHDSYVRMEEQKRQEFSVQDAEFDLKSNADLIALGKDILNNYLPRYLRVAFQHVPEEGISAIRDYLTSDDVLSHVSFNIGTKDLILSAEYPPDKSTLAATFKAVVAGIAKDNSTSQAETFILDFVCPQLIGKDIFEIWDLRDPLQVLNSLLRNQGREPTESRLLFESGRNCLEAVYHVGLYSNKVFLGRGVGETLSFAEEMAAYDVLRKMFHLNDSREPLILGDKAKKLDFNTVKKNISLSEMYFV